MSFVSDRERNPLLGSDPLPGGIVPKKMTYLNLGTGSGNGLCGVV